VVVGVLQLVHLVVQVPHLEHVVQLLEVARVEVGVVAPGPAVMRKGLVHEHHELLEVVGGACGRGRDSVGGRGRGGDRGRGRRVNSAFLWSAGQVETAGGVFIQGRDL
jgi:hypothetical protein